MEAGEPEESAAAENVVEEKEGERKEEKMGSVERESSAEEAVVVGGCLKVERRWSGVVTVVAGDLAAAGEAIFGFSIMRVKRNDLPALLCLYQMLCEITLFNCF